MRARDVREAAVGDVLQAAGGPGGAVVLHVRDVDDLRQRAARRAASCSSACPPRRRGRLRRRSRVRRSAARNQAGRHRPQDPEAAVARGNGDAAAADRVLRYSRVRGPDAPATDRLAARRGRGRVPAGSSQRTRPEGTSDADQGRRAAAGVAVLQPERIRDEAFSARSARCGWTSGSSRPTAGSCRTRCWRFPGSGMINVHASLLPKYRGAAPVHRAVIDGERRDRRHDHAGGARARCGADARGGAARDRRRRDERRGGAGIWRRSARSAPRGRRAAGTGRRRPRSRRTTRRPPTRTRSRSPKGRSTGRCRPSRIHNLVRGLQPWPLVSGRLDGRRLIVHRTAAHRRQHGGRGRRRDQAAGDDAARLPAATPRVRILQIQPEGKRAMTARELLAGHPIRVGARFAAAMIAPARLAAYSVLRAVSSRRADLPAALARRAHLARPTSATARWPARSPPARSAGRRPSIIVIAVVRRRPLEKLDAEVVDILRLTLFQLLHLDRVPASAAVNDAVDLAGKAGKRSAAPLVNAVCARASRERDPPAAAADAPIATLRWPTWRRRLSHPRVAGRAMAATGTGSTRPKRGPVQQRARAADAAREHAADDA